MVENFNTKPEKITQIGNAVKFVEYKKEEFR